MRSAAKGAKYTATWKSNTLVERESGVGTALRAAGLALSCELRAARCRAR
jgi:hypothetical protein